MALKRTGDATTDRCDEVDAFRNGESTIKEERRRCGEDILPGLPMLFRLIWVALSPRTLPPVKFSTCGVKVPAESIPKSSINTAT